ncbi:MAG: PhoPQ-activated pathogenicity-like protein PqaA type [Candidatus Cloacimonetes bacterium]|nr:PhoPQ-activated pathogenicity-like protein PqaA type [Candidatus Cloacimonadota bacterium]
MKAILRNLSISSLEINVLALVLVVLTLFLSVLLSNCDSSRNGEAGEKAATQTPLDVYLDTADSNFHYQVMHQSRKEKYTLYILRMVSQKWLNDDLVEHPTWWHWVSIVVPDKLEHDTALLWIGGGDRKSKLPEQPSPTLVRSALATHSIVVGVHNIPNQPIHFIGDTMGGRYEDEIIAYGWRKFLEGGAGNEDAEWLARLPMTNAVQCAMDAVSEYVSEKESVDVTNFAVAGASKRGWTTWTTAATDDRVVAMFPILIDLLNMEPSFKHHWRNYGSWAPAINDYVSEGIMDWIGSEEFDRLMEITEPYSYIDRYDMPKLLINATGDQFFQPDSWQFYWEDLEGEKYLRYVPNTGHSMDGTDAVETLTAFYDAILKHEELPDYSWEIGDSNITLTTDPTDPIGQIKLWWAVNEEARDFRVSKIGKVLKDSTININENGKYNIRLAEPDKGWKAYFIEITYDYELPVKLTTGVTVLPREHPYPPFESPDPKGER